MGFFTDQPASPHAEVRGAQRRTTSLAELGILAALGLVGLVLAIKYDAFEGLLEWAADHDWLQFDEISLIVLLESIGLALFAWRRYREAQAETHRLVAAERDLAHTTERYRSLFEENPHAVFSLDLEGRFQDVNAAGVRLGGRPAAEMRGMRFSSMIELKDLDRAREAYAEVMARRPQEFEVGVIHKDGHHIDLRITGLPIVVHDQVVGVFVIAEDITEHQRTRRERDEALVRAEQASEAKSLFLANMSHELRTPLTTVLGTTELLLDTPLDSSQTKFVRVVERRGRELSRMVEDILDFSRLEARSTQVVDVSFALSEAIDGVVDEARTAAERKGLAFTVHLEQCVPQQVVGDPGRLAQVLRHLLDNAVKFTDAGRVRLTVTHEDTEHLLFAVDDTGIGITAEHEGRLFESFAQADPSATRKYGGTGLGLALCHELAVLMGGSIRVESSHCAGSRFELRLPLREA
ncbi:HAMP domain-containing sensor histidine kinase [Nocardioides sp. LS1]|uniref:sensor histidine kinase n=1 Tax=Nocardioides sp. LS1 TaxID=1027620 RepID=UPI000F6178FC|nr:ATP-binding protein [Nocardioides sp. LS1]GCD90641.1 hypothetical protein NLS1_26470 [Nocardioides sp. LS1]